MLHQTSQSIQTNLNTPCSKRLRTAVTHLYYSRPVSLFKQTWRYLAAKDSGMLVENRMINPNMLSAVGENSNIPQIETYLNNLHNITGFLLIRTCSTCEKFKVGLNFHLVLEACLHLFWPLGVFDIFVNCILKTDMDKPQIYRKCYQLRKFNPFNKFGLEILCSSFHACFLYEGIKLTD